MCSEVDDGFSEGRIVAEISTGRVRSVCPNGPIITQHFILCSSVVYTKYLLKQKKIEVVQICVLWS